MLSNEEHKLKNFILIKDMGFLKIVSHDVLAHYGININDKEVEVTLNEIAKHVKNFLCAKSILKDAIKNNTTTVSLSNKYLFVLPVSINKLVKLENLFLVNNNLRSLPSEIRNLTKLKVLGLSFNKLGGKCTLDSELVNGLIKPLGGLPKGCMITIANNNFTEKQKNMIINDERLKHLKIFFYGMNGLGDSVDAWTRWLSGRYNT